MKAKKTVYTTIKEEIDGELVDIRSFDLASLYATLRSLPLKGVDVVNFSFGTTGCPTLMQHDPVRKWLAENSQTQFAVAAGNHGTTMPAWPASFSSDVERLPGLDHVISVGALDMSTYGTATVSDFSATGPTVDVYAEGTGVRVQHPSGDVAAWSGTSFAAPLVAALLAMDVAMGDLKDDGWIEPNTEHL